MDTWGWHRVNNNVAIWSREKEDISDEEYQKFYKAISKETVDAHSWIHFKAEGEVICRKQLLSQSLFLLILAFILSAIVVDLPQFYLIFLFYPVRLSSSVFYSYLERPTVCTKTITTVKPV